MAREKHDKKRAKFYSRTKEENLKKSNVIHNEALNNVVTDNDSLNNCLGSDVKVEVIKCIN